MKLSSLISLGLIFIVLLAGCGGAAALEEGGPAAATPEVEAVAATATAPAPNTATPLAATPERSSPLPTPTPAEAAPAETPVVAAGGPEATGDEAAQLASQALQQQLGLNSDEVEILQVEPAEWPDSCMGLGRPEEQCARMITPGYIVSLEAQGQQYQYHVDQYLSDLRLVTASPAEIGKPVLAWHREGGIAGFCEDVVVYMTGIATVTSCKQVEPQELGPVHLTPEELDQLSTWVDTLQNFEVEEKDPAVADAMTVRLLFSGSGSQDATPADREAMLALVQTLFQRGEAQ